MTSGHASMARENFIQACRILKQASELAPDDVYILDEYARACFNLATAENETAAKTDWNETISAFRAVLELENKQQLGLPMLKEASVFWLWPMPSTASLRWRNSACNC